MSRRANVFRHGANHRWGASDPMAVAWESDGDPAFSGGAVVATTVAGLGTPYDGKLGLLRSATAITNARLFVVYDAAISKWISEWKHGPSISENGFSATSTAWVNAPGDSQRAMLGGLGWYSVGLRLQADWSLFMVNSGANDTEARLAVLEFDDTDGTTSVLWTGAADSVNGTTGEYRNSTSWDDITGSAPSKESGFLVFQGKVGAGTGTWRGGASRYRWVSA